MRQRSLDNIADIMNERAIRLKAELQRSLDCIDAIDMQKEGEAWNITPPDEELMRRKAAFKQSPQYIEAITLLNKEPIAPLDKSCNPIYQNLTSYLGRAAAYIGIGIAIYDLYTHN